ncbi:MAG TPA: isoprenylcysteine carboxylmethyltransferase family protein [Gammaproteobacteria bacterium]|nr:isoprenylcysteine carboxylmethyltransferase family protein [Gammaproteobacteria bacterium]
MKAQGIAGATPAASPGLPCRCLVLFYGLLAYAVFFGVFAYFIAFVADLFVPRTVNHGPEVPPALAAVTNLSLIMLFAVQHTGMARSAFKHWLTRFMPVAAERSTYVLAASLMLGTLCYFWRPLPGIVWQVDSTAFAGLLWTVCAAGWLLVFAASFMTSHSDLFGLRQVWLYFQRREYTHTPFVTRWLYKYIRHPLLLGLLLGIWSIPVMTQGHLLLAVGLTVYILVGIGYEERDLVRYLGMPYRKYQQTVPRLFPRGRRAD